MNDVLRQGKKLYFKNTKQYLISLITHEHNYLIWKYIVYLRKEENSKNKVLTYYYRRKNKIGAGASVIGDIRIADNVTIGAGAVVNKSCLESNVVLAGVPAKIVKYSGGAVIIITFSLEETIKYSQD